MKRYIDSNIFLNALLKNNKEKTDSIRVIKEIITGKIKASTSTLTWDEVTHVLKKYLGKKIAEKQGEKFLKMPNLEFIPTTREIIFKSQELFSKYGINSRDAIHAASAISTNSEILSQDADFDKIKELKRISL